MHRCSYDKNTHEKSLPVTNTDGSANRNESYVRPHTGAGFCVMRRARFDAKTSPGYHPELVVVLPDLRPLQLPVQAQCCWGPAYVQLTTHKRRVFHLRSNHAAILQGHTSAASLCHEERYSSGIRVSAASPSARVCLCVCLHGRSKKLCALASSVRYGCAIRSAHTH
jgi:hypothetical protein